MKDKISYYAYFLLDEDQSGVLTDWGECKKRIESKKSLYKKFKTHSQALEYLMGLVKERSGADLSLGSGLISSFNDQDIFFDSGTGRGLGVEASVTNHMGESLLKKLIPNRFLTPFGTYLIPSHKNPTNNYGELLALYFALRWALKNPCENQRIFGDSQLVIQYWSLNRKNKANLHPHTVRLIEIVSRLRYQFEKQNGQVLFIGGDFNPADLGFHKS